MKDHQAPSVESMDEGVSFILAQLKLGNPTVVHCLAGEGRTGCVLAAYLILTRKIGGDEAMTILRDIKPSFVEWQQEAAVRSYAEDVKGRPLGS